MNLSPRARAWLTVGLLWVVALLNYLDRLMITTLRDPLKADIAMTDAQFGLLTSVFLWVYGLCSPLGGYLADRFSRRSVIVGSLFVWSGVTWATGGMHSFGSLLATRAIMGLSEACYLPAALALIADHHRGGTRSLATGLHMSGIYAGAALGGLGGYIAEAQGWRGGFHLFGFIGIGYAVVIVFLLRDAAPETATTGAPETPAATVRAKEALGVLFRQPAFLVLLVVNALVGVANWGVYGWLPTYLQEHFHLGLGAAGLTATGYIQVASFLGVLTGGVWADHWSRRRRRARAWVPAIGYCLVAPCLFLAIGTSVLSWAVAGLIGFGLGRGFFDANHMPILREIANRRYSATGYGFLNFVSCLTGGLLVFVGGWLKDQQVSLTVIFQVAAGGLLLTGLLLFLIARLLPADEADGAGSTPLSQRSIRRG